MEGSGHIINFFVIFKTVVGSLKYPWRIMGYLKPNYCTILFQCAGNHLPPSPPRPPPPCLPPPPPPLLFPKLYILTVFIFILRFYWISGTFFLSDFFYQNKIYL